MATTTTRLGLDKPAYADAADIAVLNQNFDDIDNAVGMKVVTSTTRPATPWNGQIIYETDTGLTLVWDSASSVWKQIGVAATVCTSSTRPASPLNAQLIYETDTRKFLVYATSAWQDVSLVQSPNFVINGGFDIWQRGTSSTSSVSYLADRWLHSWSAGTTTVSRSTDVPTGIGATYSVSVASTSGTNPQINHRIESVNATAFAGQTVTLSVWAKSTVGTAPLAWLTQYPGSADNWGSATTDQSGTFVATMTTGSWTRYTATFTANALASRGYVIVIYRNVTTTSTTTLFAGVQLEVGSVATSFRRNAPSIQGELAACQRYYIRFTGFANAGRLAAGIQVSTTAADVMVPLPVEMRVVPTAVDSSNIQWTDSINYNAALSTLALNYSGGSNKNANLILGFAAVGAGNRPGYISVSAANGYLGFSAEL